MASPVAPNATISNAQSRITARKRQRRAWVLDTERAMSQSEIAADMRGKIVTHKARQMARLETLRLLDGRRVSISVGVSELRGGQTADAWFAEADAALYYAKHTGRDRVAGRHSERVQVEIGHLAHPHSQAMH